MRTAARSPVARGGTPVVAGVQPPGFAPVTEEVLQAIVHRLVTGLHPCKIILFGSYVSGTPTPDSDVDLLVIQQNLQSSRQNNQPSQQIARSFLSLGNKPFRLKLSRAC
jgi:Nucleotidyltransferase domain